jgi:formate hydrogenlyase transcriptional activator
MTGRASALLKPAAHQHFNSALAARLFTEFVYAFRSRPGIAAVQIIRNQSGGRSLFRGGGSGFRRCQRESRPQWLITCREPSSESALGSATTIHADVRVICATHQNLVEMIDDRQFRAGLFYRLRVFPIELPPLRERPEDIRLLVCHFAMDYARRIRKPITAVAEQFIKVLAHHSWPGNVRELQNFIERSVILSTGPVLTGSPSDLTCGQKASAPVMLVEAESSHILQSLVQTGWVVGGPGGAAARLGLRRTTLISKMRRLGLKRRQRQSLPSESLGLRGITSGSIKH